MPSGQAQPRDSAISELLIVGTGPVARALVAIAEASSFHVRVAAGPRSPNVGEFDGADEVIVTPTPATVEALRPGPSTFVVLCSEDERFLQEVARSLTSSPAAYIGIVQSETAELVGSWSDPRIHSPAGLDIAAELPEEVALSVLAEIISFRRRAISQETSKEL